jgi:lipopolysaccharide transport system permease protein
MHSTVLSDAGVATVDIRAAAAQWRLALLLGWQDVAQRYRRSRVGAFWITINMGVMIAALGLVFGSLFRIPMQEFLPFLCAGLIFWGFLSSCIGEGCTSFITSEAIILQTEVPLFVHILRTWWRNTVILFHNLFIFPVVAIIVGQPITFSVVILPLSFFVISLNVLWIMLTLATICTRYRDMSQIIQNAIQVIFYLTPIIWSPSTLPDRLGSTFLQFNPFFHLISLVRAPLLGQWPTTENWLVAVAMLIVGWTVAIMFYGRYRWRVPYWL